MLGNSADMAHHVALSDYLPGNYLAAARGRILVAEPFMTDPYFKRSVVFLCDHSEEGSFGFILNRAVELSVPEVVNLLPRDNFPLHLGGPVQQSVLYYLHRIAHLPGSDEIIPGVWASGDFELLTQFINEKRISPADIRFFVGYSGWSEKQLEAEIAQGSWYVLRAKAQHVFSGPTENLWRDILSARGQRYKLIAGFPEDPSQN